MKVTECMVVVLKEKAERQLLNKRKYIFFFNCLFGFGFLFVCFFCLFVCLFVWFFFWGGIPQHMILARKIPQHVILARGNFTKLDPSTGNFATRDPNTGNSSTAKKGHSSFVLAI